MDITTAMRKHEERILRLANVTGIGVGEDRGRPVIKVFVLHENCRKASFR